MRALEACSEEWSRPSIGRLAPPQKPFRSAKSTRLRATAIGNIEPEMPENGVSITPQRLVISIERRIGISQCQGASVRYHKTEQKENSIDNKNVPPKRPPSASAVSSCE